MQGSEEEESEEEEEEEEEGSSSDTVEKVAPTTSSKRAKRRRKRRREARRKRARLKRDGTSTSPIKEGQEEGEEEEEDVDVDAADAKEKAAVSTEVENRKGGDSKLADGDGDTKGAAEEKGEVDDEEDDNSSVEVNWMVMRHGVPTPRKATQLQWYRFDDTRVRPVKKREAIQANFGNKAAASSPAIGISSTWQSAGSWC